MVADLTALVGQGLDSFLAHTKTGKGEIPHSRSKSRLSGGSQGTGSLRLQATRLLAGADSVEESSGRQTGRTGLSFPSPEQGSAARKTPDPVSLCDPVTPCDPL